MQLREEAISMLAEQPFDVAEFPYVFLEVFSNKKTTIKRPKARNSNIKPHPTRKAD